MSLPVFRSLRFFNLPNFKFVNTSICKYQYVLTVSNFYHLYKFLSVLLIYIQFIRIFVNTKRHSREPFTYSSCCYTLQSKVLSYFIRLFKTFQFLQFMFSNLLVSYFEVIHDINLKFYIPNLLLQIHISDINKKQLIS